MWDNQDNHICQKCIKVDNLPKISFRKGKNTGMEADDNKRDSVCITNCQKASRGIKVGGKILKAQLEEME